MFRAEERMEIKKKSCLSKEQLDQRATWRDKLSPVFRSLGGIYSPRGNYSCLPQGYIVEIQLPFLSIVLNSYFQTLAHDTVDVFLSVIDLDNILVMKNNCNGVIIAARNKVELENNETIRKLIPQHAHVLRRSILQLKCYPRCILRAREKYSWWFFVLVGLSECETGHNVAN